MSKTIRLTNNLFFNTSEDIKIGEELAIKGFINPLIVEEVYQISYTYVLSNKPTMRKLQGVILIPELVIMNNHKYYAKRV